MTGGAKPTHGRIDGICNRIMKNCNARSCKESPDIVFAEGLRVREFRAATKELTGVCATSMQVSQRYFQSGSHLIGRTDRLCRI